MSAAFLSVVPAWLVWGAIFVFVLVTLTVLI